MTNLGSGLSLDEQWDLYVNESNGDLAFSRADEEVQKDLAFQLGRVLGDFVGDYMDDGKQADIELAVRRLIVNDPRIEQILQLETQTPTDRREELVIDVILETIDGTTIDEVFTFGA